MAPSARPGLEVSCMGDGSLVLPSCSYWHCRAAVHIASLLAIVLTGSPSRAEAAGAPDRLIRIVALGDSLTAGLGLPLATPFRPSSKRGSRPRGTQSRSSMLACRAIRHPRAWHASTGLCLRKPMRRSSSLARMTCSSGSSQALPAARCRKSCDVSGRGEWSSCSPGCGLPKSRDRIWK